MTRKGTKRDPDLWDRWINNQFEGEQPILSPEASIVAARKLYRHAFGKAFPGKVVATSGRRYTWVRRGVLYVNPDKREGHTRGLRSIVHDLSHYAHHRLNPKDAPHSIRQARLERRLATFAIERGWDEGALDAKVEERIAAKPEKAKPDPVVLRYRRMVNRRDRNKAEAARFARLAAKAEAEVRTYEKRHGDRLKA